MSCCEDGLKAEKAADIDIPPEMDGRRGVSRHCAELPQADHGQ